MRGLDRIPVPGQAREPIASRPHITREILRVHVPPGSPLHLIVNLKSGKGKGGECAERAEAVCRAQGREFQLHAPRRGRELAQMAQEARHAAERDGGVVAAAGGDGTVRSVAQALAGTDVPMAVIPIGTFNFFARTHGIPEDIDGALEIALNGRDGRATLGEVNGEMFLVNASIGLYAKAIREREKRTSRFGRSRLVAILSTVASIISGHRSINVQLDVDGTRTEMRTPTLFVGNNALQLHHVSLDVAQCMKEGRLAVVVMQPVGTWGLIRLTLYGLTRRLQREDALKSFCADTMTVRRPSGRAATVALDGEMLRMPTPLQFRSRRDVLRLMLPLAGTEPG